METVDTGAGRASFPETSDYVVRATAASAQIRAFAVTGRGLTEEARKAHNTSPIATAALGRTMCGALMMADMLKGDGDLLTLRINGDGPLGGIVVTADHFGGVKGYVYNPDVILPPNAAGHLNVGGAVGNGTLTVLRDLGLGGEPYVGTIALRTGEIAEDLTYYYAVSEQIPSSVGLGVLMNREDATVKQAGGFIVQLMPGAQEETIQALENNLTDLPAVTEMLNCGMSPEDMLSRVLRGMDVTITEKMPVSFSCNCSAERCERGLLLLGEEELSSMLADGKPVSMRCQFCGKEYTFPTSKLEELLEKCRLEENSGQSGEEC